MKDELTIKKNKFDLKHQALLQKLNALYVGIFTTIISFISAWIFQPIYYKTGITITIALIIILIGILKNTQDEINKNLEDIERLIR